MTENKGQLSIEKTDIPDAGLIGVEELDILIRSLTAIVKLVRKTKQKLENADMQSGLSKNREL